jgi:hypothetical protein
MAEIRNLHRDAIADQIIDFLNEGSEGRLIVFRPQHVGSDLEVQPRGNYKMLPLRFAIFEVAKQADGTFSCDVDASLFPADPRLYFFFVQFDMVTQKTGRSVWLISSEDFDQLAAPATAGTVKKFQAALEATDAYAQFLMSAEDLGKYVDDLFSGKSGRPRNTIFKTSEKVDQDKLYEFISQARQNTYAAGQMPIDRPKLTGTEQWEFQKGPWLYMHSRFEGKEHVMGQEIVYQGQQPIWGMEYQGTPLERFDTEFLKEALLKFASECRFGKTVELKKRELEYSDKGEGNHESFSGKEQILSSGKEIYQLSYRGGMLQDAVE